jgi:hypothetical protein
MSKDLLEELVKLGEESGTIAIADDPTPSQMRQHFLTLTLTFGILFALVLGG